MDTAEASINPRDRLSFALFLVVSFHATMILGVGFVWQTSAAKIPTIEVTLAQHDDREAPENADFIAQANQQGSGSADDAVATTSPWQADFQANDLQAVFSDAPMPLPIEDTMRAPEAITTAAANEEQTSSESPPDLAEPTPPDRPEARDRTFAPDIASLNARLDRHLQPDARGPRVRRLTSVSTLRAAEAPYIEAWTRQVESVGNLHYPEEARQRQLFGELRLLVAISPDGTLQDVAILQSSGHAVLDDAAVRIVRLAAPFPPFPDEMRREMDLLEIIRTWQFRRNHYSSS
jgi:periplasmic protein TonB